VVSSIVVLLEPWGKGVCSFVVGAEDSAVGPLGLQCSVQAFDLAVLPGAVGPDETCFALSSSSAVRMSFDFL